MSLSPTNVIVTSGFAVAVVHSMGFATCVHHYNIVQDGFTVLKIPCAPPFHPTSPQLLETTNIFTASIVLPFPMSYHWTHIVGSLFRLASSSYSPSNMHVQFLYCHGLIARVLLALSNIPSGLHNSLFIHYLLQAIVALSMFGNYK